jgi:hypothetical protein
MANARTCVAVVATGLAMTAVSRPAAAIEPGEVPQTKSGLFIGSSADVPRPGIYMFDRAITYQPLLWEWVLQTIPAFQTRPMSALRRVLSAL